jgi:hypothetical protein
VNLSGWVRLWIVASAAWWLLAGSWLALVSRPSSFPPPIDPRVCTDAEACFAAASFPHFQFRARFDFAPPTEGTPEWKSAVVDLWNDARVWEHEDALADWELSWRWWWLLIVGAVLLPFILRWPVWFVCGWVSRGFRRVG